MELSVYIYNDGSMHGENNNYMHTTAIAAEVAIARKLTKEALVYRLPCLDNNT